MTVPAPPEIDDATEHPRRPVRVGSVVAIWNELTPYRLHVLRRVQSELGAIRLINVFTHSVTQNSMPWRIELGSDLDIRFSEDLRIPKVDQFLHANALRLGRYILRVVDDERPAFVIMHGHRDAVRLLTIAALRRRGIPMVHASDANVFDEPQPGGLKQYVRSKLLKRVLSAMSGYMPMGVAGRAYYDMHGDRSLPHFRFPYEPDYGLFGVRDDEEIGRFMHARGLSDGRRRFLYSGRLVPVKRVDVLISAFARTAREHPQWDLVIAGQGPLEKALRNAVPHDLAERVKFIGFLQMDELRLAYASCDVLVHPSEREPWALVINEAVASGMAVIATDVTGAALELVRTGVNGMLVRPGSVAELAWAMSHVARPGVAEAMGHRSHEMLSQWRAAADPVRGFRDAFEHFRNARG